MAIAYTRVASYPDKYVNIVDITLDGSYASGGYLLDPKQLGLLAIDSIAGYMTTGEGFDCSYVSSTTKLKFWKVGAAGAKTECASGDLTSSMKCRVEATGRPIL